MMYCCVLNLFLFITYLDRSNAFAFEIAYTNFFSISSSVSYGGSFKRFIHVAALGSLVTSAAEFAPLPDAARWTQNGGFNAPKPNRGVFALEVTNFKSFL